MGMTRPSNAGLEYVLSKDYPDETGILKQLNNMEDVEVALSVLQKITDEAIQERASEQATKDVGLELVKTAMAKTKKIDTALEQQNKIKIRTQEYIKKIHASIKKTKKALEEIKTKPYIFDPEHQHLVTTIDFYKQYHTNLTTTLDLLTNKFSLKKLSQKEYRDACLSVLKFKIIIAALEKSNNENQKAQALALCDQAIKNIYQHINENKNIDDLFKNIKADEKNIYSSIKEISDINFVIPHYILNAKDENFEKIISDESQKLKTNGIDLSKKWEDYIRDKNSNAAKLAEKSSTKLTADNIFDAVDNSNTAGDKINSATQFRHYIKHLRPSDHISNVAKAAKATKAPAILSPSISLVTDFVSGLLFLYDAAISYLDKKTKQRKTKIGTSITAGLLFIGVGIFGSLALAGVGVLTTAAAVIAAPIIIAGVTAVAYGISLAKHIYSERQLTKEVNSVEKKLLETSETNISLKKQFGETHPIYIRNKIVEQQLQINLDNLKEERLSSRKNVALSSINLAAAVAFVAAAALTPIFPPAAAAFAIVGLTLGLVSLTGSIINIAHSKYKQWKAKKAQRIDTVELQEKVFDPNPDLNLGKNNQSTHNRMYRAMSENNLEPNLNNSPVLEPQSIPSDHSVKTQINNEENLEKDSKKELDPDNTTHSVKTPHQFN